MPDGVLPVDKPSGMTSHDVVTRVRRALRTRAVGHAGTLDPMATGVLVLAVGEATKLVPHLQGADKEYEARVTLGVGTDSLDAEGRVVEEAEVPRLDSARLEEVRACFLGTRMQRPPAVSAIKVNGKRAHVRARRGEIVELPEREVRVTALSLRAAGPATLSLTVTASKGFYVRVLARDMARALGTVGHLSRLRRTRSGSFSVNGCVPFREVEAACRGERDLRSALLPLERAVADLDAVVLAPSGVAHARHGRMVGSLDCGSGVLPEVSEEATLALFGPRGRLVALARRRGEHLRVVRGFRQED